MKDILLTDGFEMAIHGGDFCVGESLKQSQMLLLNTNKGEWKQHPTMGVGVVNYLEGHSMNGLSREVREQLTQDGMRVIAVNINGNQLNVEAEWK